MSGRRGMQCRVQRVHDLGPVAVVLYRLTQETGLRGGPERRVMQGEGMRERGMGFQEQANLIGPAIEAKLFEKRLK